MPTDSPASDLGTLDAATRKRLENVRYPQRAMAMDVRTVLAALDAQAARLMEVEAERDDALIVVRNAQDYLRGKYTLEPLRTLRDAVREWEAKQATGAVGAGEATDGG